MHNIFVVVTGFALNINYFTKWTAVSVLRCFCHLTLWCHC